MNGQGRLHFEPCSTYAFCGIAGEADCPISGFIGRHDLLFDYSSITAAEGSRADNHGITPLTWESPHANNAVRSCGSHFTFSLGLSNLLCVQS